MTTEAEKLEFLQKLNTLLTEYDVGMWSMDDEVIISFRNTTGTRNRVTVPGYDVIHPEAIEEAINAINRGY